MNKPVFGAMLAGWVLAGGWLCWAQEAPADVARERDGRRPPHGMREVADGAAARGLKGPEDMISHVLDNPKLTGELGLTPEQTERLRAAMLETKTAEIDLRAAMEKAALKQAQLMTAREIDEDAVLAVVDEIGNLRTQMARARMRNLILIRRTLGPEQLEKARNLMRERVENRARWRERDAERGPEGADKRERMKERPPRQRETPPAPPPEGLDL